MARQSNIFKMEGTIGGVTFYKTADGFLTREKGGVSAERIKNDPGFVRTRENMSEFGAAGQDGQLLRHTFSTFAKQAGDSKMISRLVKKVRETMKSDTTSKRGERRLEKADLTLLSGFDFNEQSQLSSVFTGIYTPSFVKATGLVTIAFEPFQKAMQVPHGATHFQFLAAAAVIDFASDTRTMMPYKSDIMPCDESEVAPESIVLSLPADTTLPVFIVLGIAFMQEVNNEFYSFDDNTGNPLKLIAVIKP